MGTKRSAEVKRVESLREYLVELQQCGTEISGQERVHQAEGIIVVQNIEILQDLLVLDVSSAECYRLVEDSQGITHRTVRLHGNHVQGLVVDGYILFRSYRPEVPDYVRYADTVEIESLAA